MFILAVLFVLLTILMAATWSSARSYFAKGRLAGMEEATIEIILGINSHYESIGQPAPDHVRKAVEAVKSFARGACYEKSIHRYHARLWIFGDAVGATCWRKGYDACKTRMRPGKDRIRIDLSASELLHLVSLAHLGFKKMMPNDRGIEMHRFGNEDDARDGTRAIERLELALPVKYIPFDDPLAQSVNRQALIQNWWSSGRSATVATGY
jgi:hypothetical protein